MSDADAPTVAVLEPAGAVSSRAAVDFEKDVLKTLAKGNRSFVIDFTKVELFTSAGIRVLVMLRQRLQAIRGQLVLCAMSPHVRLVFEVAGLTTQFLIVNERGEAMTRAAVAPAPAPAMAPQEDEEPEARAESPGAAAPEASLSAAVRAALEAAGVRVPTVTKSTSSPLAASVREALERLPRAGRS